MKVLLIALSLAAVATTVSHARLSCPSFWHLFKGNCYRYYGERLTWAEAEDWCHESFSSGGIAHLTSVENLEENTFLYELFRSSAGDTPNWVYDATNRNPVHGVWLGVHQDGSDGPWLNTDGTTATYFNWKTGEPNNDYYGGEQTEDCVHIWRINDASDTQQIWNDMYCGEVMSFICEMPAANECP